MRCKVEKTCREGEGETGRAVWERGCEWKSMRDKRARVQGEAKSVRKNKNMTWCLEQRQWKRRRESKSKRKKKKLLWLFPFLRKQRIDSIHWPDLTWPVVLCRVVLWLVSCSSLFLVLYYCTWHRIVRHITFIPVSCHCFLLSCCSNTHRHSRAFLLHFVPFAPSHRMAMASLSTIIRVFMSKCLSSCLSLHPKWASH